MQQPAGRKSASQVSEDRSAPKEKTAPPMSPKTILVLNEQSLDGRRKYHGKFPFKVPSMGDRVDIGVLKTKYLNEIANVEGEGYSIAESLAYLGITLNHDKCPQWWQDSNRGIELYDFQPMLSLYAQARAYAATFLGAAPEHPRDEGADAGGSGAEGDGDVEHDVQPPSERSETLVSFGPGSDGTDGDVPGGQEP